METKTSYSYFDNYVTKKIKATEDLIQLTKLKLGIQKPRFWKVKQLQEYCKNLNEAKEKINHLTWLVREMDFLSFGQLES